VFVFSRKIFGLDVSTVSFAPIAASQRSGRDRREERGRAIVRRDASVGASVDERSLPSRRKSPGVDDQASNNLD
jgi:hypothetical protein